MPALILDCYIPSHREHSTKEWQLMVSSTSKALIIWSLKVDDGSWDIEDLQELNERSEPRSSIKGWPVSYQWGVGDRKDDSGVKVIAVQM